MKLRLLDEIKKTFKPEFLNRVDDVIVFRSLTREDLKRIVEIEIDAVLQRMKEKEIEMTLDATAKDFLIDKGFDKAFGARPLKRVIQRYLENPLAEELLSGTFKKGGKVKVRWSKGKTDLDFIQAEKETVKAGKKKG